MTFRQRTIFQEQALDPDSAIILYETLLLSIQWEDGIKSRNGFTRKAKAIDLSNYPDLDKIINDTLSKITDVKYDIFGAYLNYYQNGNMYTPNHSHSGTSQLVLSLGATRDLTLGKKRYKMNNGDAILFGSSVHGVPKDPTVEEGRISIATFMKKITR